MRVQVAPTLPPIVPVTNVPVNVGSGPSGVAVSGGFAYVINYDSNNVTVINTATNQFVKTLAVGAGPLSVAANPQRNRVYVSNSLSNSVSVIDTTTNAVIGTVPINVLPGSYNDPWSGDPVPYPNRVTEVAASGNRLYVNSTDGRITVIDTTNDSNTVIRTDSLGTFSDLKVSPDGTRLYGTSGTGLTVINTSTMTTRHCQPRPHVGLQQLPQRVHQQRWQRGSEPRREAGLRDLRCHDRRKRRGRSNHRKLLTDAQGRTWMVTGGYSAVSVIDTDPMSVNYNKEIARVIVPFGVHDVAVSPEAAACMSRVGMARLSPSSTPQTMRSSGPSPPTRQPPVAGPSTSPTSRTPSTPSPPSPDTSPWARTAPSTFRTTPTAPYTPSTPVRQRFESGARFHRRP